MSFYNFLNKNLKNLKFPALLGRILRWSARCLNRGGNRVIVAALHWRVIMRRICCLHLLVEVAVHCALIKRARGAVPGCVGVCAYWRIWSERCSPHRREWTSRGDGRRRRLRVSRNRRIFGNGGILETENWRIRWRLGRPRNAGMSRWKKGLEAAILSDYSEFKVINPSRFLTIVGKMKH